MGPHTTSLPGAMASDDEIEQASKLDPISRLRTWLSNEGIADENFFTDSEKRADDRVAEVRAGLTATRSPPIEDLTQFVFENPWGESQ